MSGSSEYLAVLKASYDYVPQSEDEVEIKEDQLVFLVERTDDEWWKVKVKQEGLEDKGPVGLVPASYLEDATAISVVKALYDYDASAPGELTIKEDEELQVYDKEDEWILVKKKSQEKVGYVPANYCEEGADGAEDDDAEESPAATSPPAGSYIDPAERVAASSSALTKADSIQTWALSEVDAKNKKKKGTLGVGNGSLFFASESDKTPVQKWDSKDIISVKTEKSKHIHIDIGGPKAASLHFHATSKEVEAIVKKLEESKALATTLSPPTSPAPERARSPPAAIHAVPPPSLAVESSRERKPSVHFDNKPSIIPPPDDVEGSEAGDDATDEEGEAGTALYDFAADGEDELSVREGEKLRVLDRANEEWWKCRNAYGAEGVVPASYVEIAAGTSTGSAVSGHDDDDAEAEREAELAAEREEEERQEQERQEQERKKKQEAERKAKAAAAAAAAERKRKAEADRARKEEEEEEKARREAEEEAEAEAKRAQQEKEKERRRRREEEERRAKEAERERERPPPNGASAGAGSSKRADKERERRKPDPVNVRTWHDRTGQFQVDAEFLGFNNGLLRLHKTNGVIIEVPSEKMSAEDMQYIDRFRRKQKEKEREREKEKEREKEHRRSSADEDDVPLGTLQRNGTVTKKPEAKALPQQPPKKKGPKIDWFEFFLNAGCDIDDCTRYAASFERDKIDEAILPDIKESTLRSLGLREGDIIRVTKVIEQRKVAAGGTPQGKEQLQRDEQLARQLQAQEDAGVSSSPGPGNVKRSSTASPAPNLFAGPDGVLKPRRGRPEKNRTAPPTNVSLDSIASVPERTESPGLQPPTITTSPSPAVPPKHPGGFDDDAWTVRPTKSPAPPPASVASPPAAPPAPTPPPPPPAPPPSQAPQPARPVSTNPTPTTQDPSTFDILSKIAAYRPPSAPAPASQPLTTSPPPSIMTPPSFHTGLGMGSSPLSMSQHLQAQQTGMIPSLNAPRGPLAPVPTNQSLLQPLVPTTTGFGGFVPTRPSSNPMSYQQTGSPFQTSPFQNPSAFTSQPMMSQPTGYPLSASPLQFQQTGMPQGGLNGFGTGYNGSPFMGGVQSNPTGYNPSFNQSFQTPPVPPLPQSASPANAAPANIFAQMKAGTFASDDDNGPQSADRYDALRQPTGLAPQPTGWGQMNGYQTYGYQQR